MMSDYHTMTGEPVNRLVGNCCGRARGTVCNDPAGQRKFAGKARFLLGRGTG